MGYNNKKCMTQSVFPMSNMRHAKPLIYSNVGGFIKDNKTNNNENNL